MLAARLFEQRRMVRVQSRILPFSLRFQEQSKGITSSENIRSGLVSRSDGFIPYIRAIGDRIMYSYILKTLLPHGFQLGP